MSRSQSDLAVSITPVKDRMPATKLVSESGLMTATMIWADAALKTQTFRRDNKRELNGHHGPNL
jgi:hypothetical protein